MTAFKESFIPKEFGVAKWMWSVTPEYLLENSWMQARRVFDLATVPRKAEICITADMRYLLYVNGKYVNEGPARGFQESWPFDRIDIAPYLKKGKNVIAALVAQPGRSTFYYVHRDCAGLLVGGKAGGVVLDSGPEWRVRPMPGMRRDVVPMSLQLGFQEQVDTREYDGDWTVASYKDSSWKEPHLRTSSGMPYYSFEERAIPQLRVNYIKPERVVATSSGKCAKDFDDTRNVVRTYCSEKQSWKDAAAKFSGKLKFSPTGKGKFSTYILDVGRETIAAPRLKVTGGKGGEIVDFIVCETLSGLVPDIRDTDDVHCRMAMAGRLTLSKGKCGYEYFHPLGFRYILVTVRNSTSNIEVGLDLRETFYPLDVKMKFDSSREKLNDIFKISAHTQQCCMIDAYVDCPWREQAQWWGDARVQARNTFYLSADARLLARGIRQIGAQRVPNGLTYGHAPTRAHHCILPDFTLVWVLTHHDYYWQTGDLSLFKDLSEGVEDALAYFERNLNKQGLLPFDPRYWLFLDWCALPRENVSTLYNLMYLMALRAAAELFGKSNMRKQAAKYKKLAADVETSITKHLYDKKNKVMFEGLSLKNKLFRETSVQSASLAILLNLFPEAHESMIKNTIVPFLKRKPEVHVTPSPFFSYYVFEAMKKKNMGEELLTYVQKWWGEFVDAGLSTTPENWGWDSKGARGNSSMCHAWSAHPIVHFAETLLGISQTKAGWAEVSVKPLMTKGEKASGIVPTPKGNIKVAWDWTKGEEPKVDIKVPKAIKLKR